MAKLIAWRTDAEIFNPGCEVRSRGDHAITLDCAHKTTEEKLREEMVNGHDVRANSLYTWRDEVWARKAWEREPTKHLYKLEIDENDIRHEGDVCYYTEIGEALARNHSANAAVEAYVTGTDFVDSKHFKARVEILVTKAVVLKRFDPPPA